MKTLVLGLGNPIMGDDSVGLRVAQRLRELLADHPEVEIDVDYWGGLRLMERMVGFQRAIVIDAIVSGEPPGTVRLLSPGDVATQRSASAHDVNLATALAVGRQAKADLPADDQITLVAVETGEVHDFEEGLTPPVEQAVLKAVRIVLGLLGTEGESGD